MRAWVMMAVVWVGMSSTGCMAGPGASSTSVSSPLVINDLSLNQAVERSLSNLQTQGKLVPLKTLQIGLTNRTCAVALPKSAASGPMSADEIYRQGCESVMLHTAYLKCGRCTKWHTNSSTCYAITEDGVFVANYHAFKGDGSSDIVGMAACNLRGEAFPIVKILAANEGADICIFRVDLGGKKVRPIPLGANAPVGSLVYVLSHPTNLFYTFTQGEVARYFQEPSVPPARLPLDAATLPMHLRMAITADYAKGSSGGPVLNSMGQLVGMVASTRSIYYTEAHGQQENLQMVLKSTVPVHDIRQMIRNP